MRNYKSDSTTIVQVVCAIIFVIFSIHYIFSFQGDILGMMQYSWSDHETHYDRLIGGGIIFIVLLIITYIVNLFYHFHDRLKALVYLPTMLIMGQITAVTVDEMGNVTMPWHPAWFTILLLLCYPLIVKLSNKIRISTVLPHDAEFTLTWLTNGVILALLMIMTYSIGNTNRNLHTRLAVERLCHEGKYAEALAEGIPQHDHGAGITMWRAYALSHTNIGEKLFTYNIENTSSELCSPEHSRSARTILPKKGAEPHALLYDCYPIWQAIGFVPRNINEDPLVYLKREIRRHTARPAAKDYLLCTYLLRKDISTFAQELPRFYDVKESMPKHYMEALVMYYNDPTKQAQMLKDSVQLDSAMVEDYHDFQDLLHMKKPDVVKQSKLRDSYFGTYWYYFYRKD